MNIHTRISKRLENINDRCATRLLILLFSVDLVFIVLYAVKVWTPYLNHSLFSLQVDRSYSEIFQYLKWLSIIILLVSFSISRRSSGYALWGVVFTYFLLDDALQFHERIGRYVHINISNDGTFIPPFGLRFWDLGELACSGVAGLVFIFPIIWAYKHGSQAFKKLSEDILLLIFILVFFGVFMDMAHICFARGIKTDFVFCVIEEGGEMLTASLILWYVFIQTFRNLKTPAYYHHDT